MTQKLTALQEPKFRLPRKLKKKLIHDYRFRKNYLLSLEADWFYLNRIREHKVRGYLSKRGVL